MVEINSNVVGRIACLLYRFITAVLLCIHDPAWHLRSLAATVLGVNIAGLIYMSYLLLQGDFEVPDMAGLKEPLWSVVYHVILATECFSLIVALVYITQVDALRVAGAMIFANLVRLALYSCKQRA